MECLYADGPAAWEKVEPVFLRENITGLAPRQRTWFKTTWNENGLFVFFHAEDTEPWATLTEHDAPLYNEEVVEVFLDPAGDLESYFEIEVNPLNTVCDLVLRRTADGYRKDFGWHCKGLRSSAGAGPGFWTVELAIPFSSLGCRPPDAGCAWRVNFFRIDRPKNEPWELSAWSPTGRPLFHEPHRFGALQFAR